MVAGTRESTTQQPAHVSSVSPEEEALKRNTDCVYFLASPLTCKKGSECEYRHSEYARVNPRDCWYWLNGSCLNPKCAFRHPPLDGLLGTQSGISSGSSVPMQQSVMPPVAQAPQSSGKQAVPCIFFQKGLCLKGDRCAFLHGANPVGGKAQLAPAATPVKEPSLKKPFGGLEKCSQEPKVQQNFPKFTPVASAPKPTPKAENALLRNGANIEKAAPPPALSSPGIIEEGASRYRSSSTPIINGSSQGRSSRSHLATVPDDYVSSHKDKEADEYLRESSPGFDVLVDDELGDSDYYHSEDQFGRGRAHEGRNLSSVTEYDLDHPGDYSTDINHEIYESHGYEPYERIYGWDQLHESSELMLGGSTQRERKAYPKSKSPGHADDSDLRHRLSKHRRVNGLRSVVSHDFVADDHVERTYHGSSRRDSQQLPSQEGHISSRLKGRIKFPGRPNGNDVQSDREMERGRAPGRSYQSVSRLRDRLKGRAQDEYNTDARNLRAPRLRRESMDEKTADFAGPKSLAELKRKGKGQESSSMGRPLEQPSGGDVSFEGPKPLSVLLKRKRDAGDDGADSGSFVSKEERNREESMEKPEESKTGMHNAAVTIGHGEGACEPIGDATEIDNEDGVTAEDGMEDPELGADEQREDGDYEYEQGEEGDYHYEEAENVEAEEEEYMDDEDGDDFAKKVGVMFS